MNYQVLKDRIDYAGFFNKIEDRYNDAYEAIKAKYPGREDEVYKFNAIQEAIGDHIKHDLIDLSKWCNGPEWIGECHQVCWDFLQKGSEALPKKYLKAVGKGGFFKYDAKASVEIVMMPRGVGKTFTFSALRAVQEFLKDPSSKWLVAHSDKFKAQKNLDSIKTTIMNPWLQAVYPEIFTTTKEAYKRRGGKITNEKVNIVFNEIDENGKYLNARPEATFTVASPQVDRTGFHVDGIFADDLVTNSTSKSKEATDSLYEYYRSLWGLRQLDKPFKVFITGTEWYENSLYTILKNLPSKVTCFEMPAQWYDNDIDYRLLPHIHTDDYLEEQKVMMGADYAPQMLMQPKSLNEGLQLVTDNEFVFAFKDDVNPPSNAKIINVTRKDMERNGGIVTSFDPSYSTNDKSWNDKSSRATIVTGTIFENTLYVYDSWQALGGNLTSLYEALRNQVEKNRSNVVVVDSQSYQISLSDEYKRRLKVDTPWLKHFLYHTKASVKGTKGKAERAMHFLGSLFNERVIYIHYSQKELIDEIKRLIGSYDFLDCLIQIAANVNFELASKIYKEEKRVTNFNFGKRQQKRRPFCSVTGY